MCSQLLRSTLGLCALFIPVLVFLPACQELPNNDKQTTLQLLKPLGGVDADNPETERMLGMFAFTQVITYKDANENDYWDADEVATGGPVRMVYTHNTDWRGFVEFAASGDGWSYGNGIDLPTAYSGSVDFGVVGSQIKPIRSQSVSVVSNRVFNLPSGGG